MLEDGRMGMGEQALVFWHPTSFLLRNETLLKRRTVLSHIPLQIPELQIAKGDMAQACIFPTKGKSNIAPV